MDNAPGKVHSLPPSLGEDMLERGTHQRVMAHNPGPPEGAGMRARIRLVNIARVCSNCATESPMESSRHLASAEHSAGVSSPTRARYPARLAERPLMSTLRGNHYLTSATPSSDSRRSRLPACLVCPGVQPGSFIGG